MPSELELEVFLEEASENHPQAIGRAICWLTVHGGPLPVDLYIQLQSDGYDPESLMENF